MDPLIVTQAINVLYGVSTLAVLALGLAVIFGLLGVLVTPGVTGNKKATAEAVMSSARDHVRSSRPIGEE